MARKKSEIIAFFVQEMYVILFGVGLSNIIFLKKIDLSSLEGIGYAISALFVIGVTVRYWLDWASYISGEIRSTNNEFVIDFAILINLLLLFGYFQEPKILTILFLSLSIFDGLWVINYVKENNQNLKQGIINAKRWLLEKLVGTVIFSVILGVIWLIELDFLLQLLILFLSYISVRKLSFRSVKKARGLVFRKAQLADFNDIERIHNENARKNLNGLSKGFLLGETNPNKLKKKLEGDGSYEYWLAKQDQEVVGFIQIHSGVPKEEWDEFEESLFLNSNMKAINGKDPHHVHILTVATSIDHKGLGIGSFLYNSLFENHEDSFFSAFIVTSPYSNKASKLFHEKHGFEMYSVFNGDNDYQIKNYSSAFMVRGFTI